MTLPIALQLYSVRDALTADFAATLQRVADLGFAGVEFAGGYGSSPSSAAALSAQLGLAIPSAHLPMPIGENRQQSIDIANTLGAKTIVCAWLPPERFATSEAIAKVCDELNAADEAARAAGLKFAYHNHDFEFKRLSDGSLPYDHMRRLLNPSVGFEIDIYWVKFAGEDPALVLGGVADRVQIVHVKDGSGVRDDGFLAAGEGIVDIPATVKAAVKAEWLVVELDWCKTDVFEAVAKSQRYLVAQGLGHGR